MKNHADTQAVQRETVCLPDAPALKDKSDLRHGPWWGGTPEMNRQDQDAGMAHQTGRLT